MLYNKHQVTKTNDKKILHKVGKHWVTLSIATLMALGGYAMSSTLTTHAATNPNNNGNNDTNNTDTKGVTNEVNNRLQSAQQNANQNQQSNQGRQNSTINKQSITNAANVMHQRILNNYVKQNINKSNNDQTLHLGNPAQQKRSWNYLQHGVNGHDYDNTKTNNDNTLDERIQNNVKQLGQTEKAPMNEVGDNIHHDTIRQGTYKGLSYNYDPNTRSLEFTGGDIKNWNNPSDKYSDAFIGIGQPYTDNGKTKYKLNSNIPSDVKNAENIKFDIDPISNNGSQTFNGFITYDPNVKHIDLGKNFANSMIKSEGGNSLNGMFSSDANLESVSMPYMLMNQYNPTTIFNGDGNLNKITILSDNPNPYYNNEGFSGQLANYGAGQVDGDWYKESDTSYSHPIRLAGNKPQPGTYVIKPSDSMAQPSKHSINLQGNVWNNLHEGTTQVTIDGSNDTINVSDGTLASGSSNGQYREFMSDIETSSDKLINSDKLPNDNNDWTINFDNVTAPKNMSFVFSGGTSSSTLPNAIGNQVSNINLNGLDTSQTTNMQGMFENNDNLKHIEFGNIDTSNVSNMSMMLGSDRSLPSVDLSGLSGKSLNQAWDLFDTDPQLQSVTLGSKFSPEGNNVNLGEMFASDPSLTNINWNGFNTKNATQIYGMFRGDKSLANASNNYTIKLPSTFDTSNVINMGNDIYHNNGRDGVFQSDFAKNGHAGTIDLSTDPKFNLKNDKSLQGMFSSDKSLTNINFGNNFDTSNVSDMRYMFGLSDGISNLNLPASFNTSNAYNKMDGMFQSDIQTVPDTDKEDKIRYDSNGTAYKLGTLTINSSNTKINLSAWGDDPTHNLYLETGNDTTGRPVTKSSPNDFTQGNTGTFTLKNTNAPAQHKVTDIIDFETTNSQHVSDEPVSDFSGATFTITNPGNGSKNSNDIPDGYQLSNNNASSDTFTFGTLRPGDYKIGNQIVHVIHVKSNTNNQIPLSDNVADVNGTIDLHFINAQNHDQIIPLHYHKQMTANDSGVNLLNLSSDVPVADPSSYVSALGNVVSGLNANDYSYNSTHPGNTSNAATTGNKASDYKSYKINPSDAEYYNNSTHMFTGPTLNFYFKANNAADSIRLVDNKGKYVPIASSATNKLGSNEAKLSGSYGSSENTSKAVNLDIPSDYSFNSDNPSNLTINNGSDIIHVSRKQATDKITYKHNDSKVGSASITGNMDSDITPNSDNMPSVPSGYHVSPSASAIKYDNGSSSVVDVDPNTAHELIEYYYHQNGHNTLVGTQLMQGTTSESSNITTANDHNYNQSSSGYGLDSGYMLQSPATSFTFSDGETVVPVKPIQNTNKTTIDFIVPESTNGDAKSVGSYQVNDSDENPSDVFKVSDLLAPDNYHLVNTTDSIHYDGQEHDVVVAPNQVTETIQYKDSKGNEGNSFTIKGLYNTPGHVDGQKMPSDYRLANDGSQDFTFNGGTHDVNVLADTHTDSVTFVNQHGIVVGYYNTNPGLVNKQLSGYPDSNNDNRGSDTVSDHVPNGYTDLNAVNDQHITYDGLNHVIRVQGNPVNYNNGIATNTSSNKPSNTKQYAIITIHEKDANGSDTNDTPITYYVPIKGYVGDKFSLTPNDFNHDGYNITPSDASYNGVINTSDLTSNLPHDNKITWNYTTPAKGNRSTLVYYRLNSDNGRVISSGASNESGSKIGTPITISQIAKVPSGYHLVDPNSINGKTVQDGQQILNFVVAHNDIKPQDVHVNLVYKNNNRVTHVDQKELSPSQLGISMDNDLISGDAIGKSYIVLPDNSNLGIRSGYTEANSDAPLFGRVTENGLDHTSVTFTYNAQDKDTTINFVAPNDKNVGTTTISGQPNSDINVDPSTVPSDYHIIPGQNYTIPSDNGSVNVKVAPNDMSSYVTINRIYEFGNNVVKTIDQEPIPINIEPGKSQAIDPRNSSFMVPGFNPTDDTPWFVSYSNNPMAYTNMNHTFYYKATPVDIQVQYRNANNPNKLIQVLDSKNRPEFIDNSGNVGYENNGSLYYNNKSGNHNEKISGLLNIKPYYKQDLGTVGVDGQKINVNADNSTHIGVITGQGIYTENGTPVNFAVPQGYHLQNANNIITVTPEVNSNGSVQTDIQGHPIMLLSLNLLGASATSNNNGNNNHSNSNKSNGSNDNNGGKTTPNKPNQPNVPNKPSGNNTNNGKGNNVNPNNNNGGNNNHSGSNTPDKPNNPSNNTNNDGKGNNGGNNHSGNNTPNTPNHNNDSNTNHNSNNTPNGDNGNNSQNGNHVKPSDGNNTPNSNNGGKTTPNKPNNPSNNTNNDGKGNKPSTTNNGGNNHNGVNPSNGNNSGNHVKPSNGNNTPNNNNGNNANHSENQPKISNVTDTVEFINNGRIVNDVASTGINGTPFMASVPSGYKVNGTMDLVHNSTNHIINVEPINQNNSDQSHNNVQPSQNVTDFIDFINNGRVVGTTNDTGIKGTVFAVQVPSGYKTNNPMLTHDGTTHTINVDLANPSSNNQNQNNVQLNNNVTDFVNFVDGSRIVGSTANTGAKGTAFIVSVPAGYKADGGTAIIHSGGLHTIQVSSDANQASNTPQSNSNGTNNNTSANSGSGNIANPANANHNSSNTTPASSNVPATNSNGNTSSQNNSDNDSDSDVNNNSDNSDSDTGDDASAANSGHNATSQNNSDNDSDNGVNNNSDSDTGDDASAANSGNKASSQNNSDNDSDGGVNSDTDSGTGNNSNLINGDNADGTNTNDANTDQDSPVAEQSNGIDSNADTDMSDQNNSNGQLPQTGESKSAQATIAAMIAAVGLDAAALGAALDRRRRD